MYPSGASNGHHINFFDRFGQGDRNRVKIREELVQEYEQFKKINDEKFRNRFANKKSVDQPYDRNETFVTPTKITPIIRSSEKHSSTQQQIMPSRIDSKEFERVENQLNGKLEELTRKFDDLKNTVIKPLPTSPDQSPRYETELRQRLRILQEAESRLTSIEREYDQVKDNEEAVPRKVSPNHTKLKTAIVRPTILSDLGQFGQDVTDTNRVKQENQQRYRQDLEKQIAEMRERRKADMESEKEAERTDLKTATVLSNFEPQPIRLSDMETYSSSLANLTRYNTPEAEEYFTTGQTDLLNTSSPNKKSKTLLLQENKRYTLPPFGDGVGIEAKMKGFTSSDQDLKKAKYAEELRQQIEETKRKKDLQKKKDDEYDKKIEAECNKQNSSSLQPETRGIDSRVVGVHSTDMENSTDEGQFARGGHGIFGSPLTMEQKSNHQKYKEELARQIEDKKRQQEEERRREMEADQRETERVQAEQLRMQREFEVEQARVLAKARAAEQNAELHRLKAEQQQHPPRVVRAIPAANEKHRNLARRSPMKNERFDSNNELLIGPDLTTKNLLGKQQSEALSKPIKPLVEIQHSPIIEQLKILRTQLDAEKMRIKDTLVRYDKIERAKSANILVSDNGKSHPRVVRKGAVLFTESNGNSHQTVGGQYGIGVLQKATPLTDWSDHLIEDNRIEQLNKQQAAYLHAQDDYLNELEGSMEMLSVRELMNDAEIRRFRVEPGEYQEIQKPRVNSESSIDIAELDAKNQQRLKRLEAMQLLSDIDADPEAVLQRFMNKHDSVYAK